MPINHENMYGDKNGEMEQAFAGLPYGHERNVISLTARNDMQFGQAVFGEEGDPDEGFGLQVSRMDVVADAEVVEDDVIEITINGTVIGYTVSATDSAEDAWKAIVDQINTNEALNHADIGAMGHSSTGMTVVAPVGTTLTITGTVTGSSVAITASATTTAIFLGIALHIHNGRGYYQKGDCMSVLVSGRCWVKLENIRSTQQAKVSATTGLWDQTGTVETSAYAVGNPNSEGLTLLSVNMPINQ